VIFELSPQDLIKAMQNQQAVIAMIVEEIQKQGLDGLVSSITNKNVFESHKSELKLEPGTRPHGWLVSLHEGSSLQCFHHLAPVSPTM
jgi:hypothetical protein